MTWSLPHDTALSKDDCTHLNASLDTAAWKPAMWAADVHDEYDQHTEISVVDPFLNGPQKRGNVQNHHNAYQRGRPCTTQNDGPLREHLSREGAFYVKAPWGKVHVGAQVNNGTGKGDFKR